MKKETVLPHPEEEEKEALRERIKDLEERLKKSEMERQTDPLTQAYNRRGFKEKFEEKREASKNTTAILLLDLDNFKIVNDAYDHDTGDKALQAAVKFLRENVRPDDIVARWGGEELVVAFHDADAQDIIDKFYQREEDGKNGKAKINFKTEIEGKMENLTMSGGVATLQPGETLEDAIQRADQALYQAKHTGKDRLESGDVVKK